MRVRRLSTCLPPAGRYYRTTLASTTPPAVPLSSSASDVDLFLQCPSFRCRLPFVRTTRAPAECCPRNPRPDPSVFISVFSLRRNSYTLWRSSNWKSSVQYILLVLRCPPSCPRVHLSEVPVVRVRVRVRPGPL